ncbi:MAG: TolC family protein [Acidobacteriaceae bacterium]
MKIRTSRRAFLIAYTVVGVFVTATVAYSQQTPTAAPHLRLDIPHSYTLWGPYTPSHVPPPDLGNSADIDSLIHDGKLYLSLQDAIALGLENNLDIAIARYNLPIAGTDLQRADAGGSIRGVNTGVIQNTPGAGVGGIGAAAGAGAGGTSGGAGGAGAGAAGLVENTLGTGTQISSYDPLIQGSVGADSQTLPVVNQQIYGVPSLQTHTTTGDFTYTQAFSPGTRMEFDFFNQRQTVNSPFFNLSPSLSSNYRFELTQPLLAGFGFFPNKRYMYIAKNNEKISTLAFKAQLIATVTQIENIYWDLFNAYQDEQVQERSLLFAQQTYDNGKKQLALQAIPEMEVLRDEAEVAKRDQDVTVAKTNLQLQELLMKNAITKNLDDSFLVAMPVIPTAQMHMENDLTETNMNDLVAEALQSRPDLAESQLDLRNREITRKTARNALLPTVNLVAYIAGSGLGGPLNTNYGMGYAPGSLPPNTTTLPSNFGGALQNTFNNSSPEYYVGGQISIPIRNRVAKADQYRAELEYRQAQILQQEQRKQILIEVENAQYAFEQSRARVDSARKARDLAQKTFGIMQQEQKLGAGSTFQTLSAQHDLALAESDLVAAMTAYEKARVELDRAIGATLERNHISVADAETGEAREP